MLAALLLGLQALGPGVVSVAHATEPTTAPAGWEARHTAACIVLHDASRCALCHYAGVQFVAPTVVVFSTRSPRSPDPRAIAERGVRHAASLHAARPRAPPSVIS
jgi:hypothetical protein